MHKKSVYRLFSLLWNCMADLPTGNAIGICRADARAFVCSNVLRAVSSFVACQQIRAMPMAMRKKPQPHDGMPLLSVQVVAMGP